MQSIWLAHAAHIVFLECLRDAANTRCTDLCIACITKCLGYLKAKASLSQARTLNICHLHNMNYKPAVKDPEKIHERIVGTNSHPPIPPPNLPT